MSTYHQIQPVSTTSVRYISNLTLIEEQTRKQLGKKTRGMKNRLMFLHVSLVRSTSMFMYEWNLIICRKKKKKTLVLCSGSGAVGLSQKGNHDLKSWTSDEYK